MTQREEDFEFEIYRSTQDGMISIRTERWADDDSARRLVKAITDLLPSPWHKFDPSDETTWPPENQIRYWTVTEGEVLMRQWMESPRAWQNVTRWQEIPVPSAPSDVSTESQNMDTSEADVDSVNMAPSEGEE